MQIHLISDTNYTADPPPWKNYQAIAISRILNWEAPQVEQWNTPCCKHDFLIVTLSFPATPDVHVIGLDNEDYNQGPYYPDPTPQPDYVLGSVEELVPLEESEPTEGEPELSTDTLDAGREFEDYDNGGYDEGVPAEEGEETGDGEPGGDRDTGDTVIVEDNWHELAENYENFEVPEEPVVVDTFTEPEVTTEAPKPPGRRKHKTRRKKHRERNRERGEGHRERGEGNEEGESERKANRRKNRRREQREQIQQRKRRWGIDVLIPVKVALEICGSPIKRQWASRKYQG